MQIHLIGNSHLDPVWLWDWREGLNEALITVRTILDLMDQDESLTYIRGESVIYRHIEKTDPATFRRIVQQVKKGRWDVVGGTYLQPDTNMAGIETLARHFTEGQRYFLDRFGRTVTVAWQADSFGHTAGLPEVFAAAGIDSFAFTRPDAKAFPLESPAFWWEGASGARILSYRPLVGWYGTDHDEMPRRLEGLVAAAQKTSLQTIGCFYGLGNHGGGPTLHLLEEIKTWAAAHPEVKVIHSGLHPFFHALRRELNAKPALVLPIHRGELNFCLRGCYSSMARFKYLYREGENNLSRAEKTDAAISAYLGLPGADLTGAWRDVLFNSFHDILPGSSIERAMADQTAWMGQVIHASQETELTALNRLAEKVDTEVSTHSKHHPSAVAALVWNPHPQPYRGHIEMEACLDYRLIRNYTDRPAELPISVLGPDKKPVPFQVLATESPFVPNIPWRRRVLVPVVLPALGWNVIEMGWVEGATKVAAKKPVRAVKSWIENEEYRIEAVTGRKGVTVLHRGKSLFGRGGLTAALFDDPWGSWGGVFEEPKSLHLTKVLEKWSITGVKLLEEGPERAMLWVRLAGKKSWIDLSFSLTRGRSAVDVRARVFLAERSARLKLQFPVGDEAEFEVPGARVTRNPCGEIPGGKWFRVGSSFGFASDALYNFDGHRGVLSATVARATRYADDTIATAADCPWKPMADVGELKFNFLMTASPDRLPVLARELEQPPIVLLVPPRKGTLPRSGSLAALHPASLQLLALKRAEDGKGFILRAQGTAAQAAEARLEWAGKLMPLGRVLPGEIVSWQLKPHRTGWKTTRVDLAEIPQN